MRQCWRSFGPPWTIRCPIAAGIGILASTRSLPMRMIASRWLGMEPVSESNSVSARVFCMAFAAFVADRLGLAGEQPFDP